jgi:hypothetical protein
MNVICNYSKTTISYFRMQNMTKNSEKYEVTASTTQTNWPSYYMLPTELHSVMTQRA